MRTESDAQISADTETVIRFDSMTCKPDDGDLARQQTAAPCREVGDIIAHHEAYHHDVCVIRHQWQEARQTSWEISPIMLGGLTLGAPSADRWEEAAAYELEVAELRALIQRLAREPEAQYVLIFKSVARMDWKVPMGPAGVAAEYGSTASIPLEITEGLAPQSVSGHATRSFEGRIIGGLCQYTGMPMAIPMAVEGTLEDGVFKLRIDKDGQRLPPFGVLCPNGAGMAMPSMAPPPPVTVELEARDGARLVYPYATSGAAMMTAAVGTLSGDAVLELEVTCKPSNETGRLVWRERWRHAAAVTPRFLGHL
jgi:hypothetical protein